jgi:hypothetical protein
MARPKSTANQLAQKTDEKVTALRTRAQEAAATLLQSASNSLDEKLFQLLQDDSVSTVRSVSVVVSGTEIAAIATRIGFLVPIVQDAVIRAISDAYGKPPRNFTVTWTFLETSSDIRFSISW